MMTDLLAVVLLGFTLVVLLMLALIWEIAEIRDLLEAL